MCRTRARCLAVKYRAFLCRDAGSSGPNVLMFITPCTGLWAGGKHGRAEPAVRCYMLCVWDRRLHRCRLPACCASGAGGRLGPGDFCQYTAPEVRLCTYLSLGYQVIGSLEAPSDEHPMKVPCPRYAFHVQFSLVLSA